MANKIDNSVTLIDSGSKGGISVISKNSPLRRLHYFDGKFLRAPDLILEQQALLNQVRLSNQAGGAGVVHGFDVTRANGDTLDIGPGLAFDAKGRALHMDQAVRLGISELIEKSRGNIGSFTAQSKAKAAQGNSRFDECELLDGGTPDGTVESSDLYLITVCHAETMCGEEDVFGKLCESACISSTDRPYIIEGVNIQAIPLELSALLKTSSAVALSQMHLRSRVASAYFEQERQHPASHISKEGLNSSIWCLGAEAISGDCVPIAVVSRSGSTTQFLDAWTVRRERMESPPRHYWASIMAMRPWQVFLAQVLQFQCQLSKCLGDSGGPVDEGPCAEERALARKAAADMKVLMERYEAISSRFAKGNEEQFLRSVSGESQSFAMADFRHTYQQLLDIDSLAVPERLLINHCGIVELPAGGYLPVNNSDAMSINEQVRRMMGEGVDLRFCVVRPDYVPHALEEAQHMERICLLKGLDDPGNKPRVDVLVPDGRIETYEPEVEGTGYEMDLRAGGDDLLGDIGRTVKSDEAVAGIQNLKSGDQVYARSSFGFEGIPLSPKGFIAARASRQADETVQVQADDQDEMELRGAARGEALDSGGFAFYFAGRMPQLMRKVVTELSRNQILQQAGDSILSQANSSHDIYAYQKMADKTAADNTLSTGATTEKIEAEARAATIEMAATNRLSSGLRINRKTSEPVYDMWLSMRTEQDPFKLQRGGISSVSAELVVMVSQVVKDATGQDVAVNIVIEVTQNGGLTVEEILSSGAEPRRRCTISSNGMINLRVNTGANDNARTMPLKLAETLYISRENNGSGRPTFKMDLPELSAFDALDRDNLDIDVGLHFIREWINAEEAALKGFVSYLLRVMTDNQDRQISDSMPLFTGTQRINPDVLKPDNLRHDTALTALREIGNGLDDRGFADIRARQLFPPPKPVPEELLVYGTRDWVFFHRRRDIACGHDEAPQAVVKPLRYRIYYVNSLTSKEEFELLRRGLLDNNGTVISRFEPIASSIVEYDAGLSSVRTSHTNLRNDWRTLVNDPGAELVLGAIGSRGKAFDEGAAMAQLRLESIGDVLTPVTPFFDEAELFTMPTVPDVLAEGSVDGVIVLATVNIKKDSICHQVYRVEMTEVEPEAIKAFRESLGREYSKTLVEFKAQLLDYNPQFIGNTADFANAEEEVSIQTAWQAVGNSQPQHLFVVAQRDEAGNPINDQPYLDQGLGIGSALQAPPNMQSEFVTVPVNDDFGDCLGVTILVTTPQLPSDFGNVAVITNATGWSTATSATLVSDFKEEIIVDDNGNVTKDAAYETAVTAIAERGELVKNIEIIGLTAEEVEAERKKTEVILTEMRAAGVADADTKIVTRVVKGSERTKLEKLGTARNTGVIMTR